eukprot:30891-Pelagococcus_subviridis.AAC.3
MGSSLTSSISALAIAAAASASSLALSSAAFFAVAASKYRAWYSANVNALGASPSQYPSTGSSSLGACNVEPRGVVQRRVRLARERLPVPPALELLPVVLLVPSRQRVRREGEHLVTLDRRERRVRRRQARRHARLAHLALVRGHLRLRWHQVSVHARRDRARKLRRALLDVVRVQHAHRRERRARFVAAENRARERPGAERRLERRRAVAGLEQRDVVGGRAAAAGGAAPDDGAAAAARRAREHLAADADAAELWDRVELDRRHRLRDRSLRGGGGGDVRGERDVRGVAR